MKSLYFSFIEKQQHFNPQLTISCQALKPNYAVHCIGSKDSLDKHSERSFMMRNLIESSIKALRHDQRRLIT